MSSFLLKDSIFNYCFNIKFQFFGFFCVHLAGLEHQVSFPAFHLLLLSFTICYLLMSLAILNF